MAYTKNGPTRFPGGLVNVPPSSPFAAMETLAPLHQVLLGFGYDFHPGIPTGNTPATNSDVTITSVTTTGTASFNPANTYPPTHLLTTGTTANDQVVFQDKRTLFTNFLSRKKVLVAGSFNITSTVANAAVVIGLLSGTSLAALGNDQFLFNKPSGGSTLNFVNRNNGGTALTTAINTGITINTTYGVAALLDPFKSVVQVWFGAVDGLDLTLAGNDIPGVATIAVSTANVPDGTNAIQLGFGAQTTAAAAATVRFGPCFAMVL